MANIKYHTFDNIPLEMHKAKIVQKLNLVPIERRKEALTEAGNNTFLLKNKDVFLDMLTDSGVNAMSDHQLGAMMIADDSYAGSGTFTKLEDKLADIFGKKYFLPAHQGRACEHLIAKIFVKPGDTVAMNYHFTTAKAHILLCGGSVVELVTKDGLEATSDLPFKGNIDLGMLEDLIAKLGSEKIPFMRMEAGTNLIGGQPFSLKNLADVSKICRKNGIPLVLDASLLADNLYFIKTREAECADKSIREITRAMADLSDVIYFSARKLGCARGGGICVSDESIYLKLRQLLPVYEGFLTYGGMSVREMEAMTVGLEETMDIDMISQGPIFIDAMVRMLEKNGVPVITPPGGLGCHVDASRFLPHIPQEQYTAGALASAIFLAGGTRGMERGTLSEERDTNGNEVFAEMELVRLALPRRVFTLSQVQYTVDRLTWLYENRNLIGGLKFIDEPPILRFFVGKLAPVSDWQEKIVAKFRADFGDSL